MSLNGAYPPPGREEEHRRYCLLPGEIEQAAMRIGGHQYLGAAVDARDADALVFHWCGDVPDEITEIIARSGVKAEVRPVPFPADLLHQHARRLAARPHVTSAGFGADFRSLLIHVLPGTTPAEVERLCLPIPAAPDHATAERFPDVREIRVAFGGYRGPLIPL